MVAPQSINFSFMLAAKGQKPPLEEDPGPARRNLACYDPTLSRAPLGRCDAALVEGEHRVYEVHVGINGLLRKRLGGFSLSLLLIRQSLGHLAVLVGLAAQVVDDPIEEGVRHLDVEFLGRDGTAGHRLVRLPKGIGELLGRFTDLLLTLSCH